MIKQRHANNIMIKKWLKKGFKDAERSVCNFGKFKIQFLALGSNHGAFDGMLQFSDVTGPGVALQHLHGALGDLRRP